VRAGDLDEAVVDRAAERVLTCEICRAGYRSSCMHREAVARTIGTQSERARIPTPTARRPTISVSSV
jgi:hypothetical protein